MIVVHRRPGGKDVTISEFAAVTMTSRNSAVVVCGRPRNVAVLTRPTNHSRRTDLMHIGQRLPRGGIMLAPALFLLFAASSAIAQGNVTGRVTAQGSNEPLAESRVAVVGTNLVGLTAADGRYTIRNVPAGDWTVR